jgi:hypothetical protein
MREITLFLRVITIKFNEELSLQKENNIYITSDIVLVAFQNNSFGCSCPPKSDIINMSIYN